MPAPAEFIEQSASILDIVSTTFLNRLFHLSDAHLVVRAGGVSLFRRTEFGLFDEPRTSMRKSLHDSTSGLRIDPGRVRSICHVGGGSVPDCFEIDLASIGFSLAIFPGSNSHDRRITAEILDCCSQRRVPLQALRSRGFGMWLDEGLSCHGNCWRNRLLPVRDRSERLRLDLASPALEVSCFLQPSGIDRAGSLWRIFDASREIVLHLDPAHPSFGRNGLDSLSDHFSDFAFPPFQNHHIPNATASRN